ncbi:hypothetical protein [Ferruginivarius sediminum]|uniref:Uncharacterized protein n=1 Tax=Ferruginivarius sediminum TaxID=2661937 RepID=A0A369TBD2_9PROT|nr:hypothetical protein [Ferruginivarius sediminum]RDD62619.1 hypothetical protein DRB17_05510 [Ferruginivarius sediminum]
MASDSTIRALAMHAALVTGGDLGAVERAERYARLIAEYAETGDCAELRQATEATRQENADVCHMSVHTG